MYLKDAEGNLIADGSGWVKELDGNLRREQIEIQSFAEIPDALIIEAKAIDGNVLGSVRCGVTEEN